MPWLLRHRNSELVEQMDAPDCDPVRLRNTYRDFIHINRTLSGWQKLFDRYIAPLCENPDQTYTLLDIGFGGGDIPLLLHRAAARRKIRMNIRAIDPDPRAMDYVAQLNQVPDTITFEDASHTTLLERGEQFDFVVSNHVLHHLPPQDVQQLCSDADRLACKRVVFSDLQRSDWAWLIFAIGTYGRFRNSFIREDGLRSIRRSYTPKELREYVPSGWHVDPYFPFRIIARSS